jgi:hypothetical protein
VIGQKLLLFIGVIIGLGFLLLLLLAFRSLLVPATAAVMNLLAAGAAFGVLIAIFQFGWGLRILNLGQAGPVESFLPVLMLSVLFGLSMDYEVFLVSRIREEWAATGDNHQAVRTGQATTGRVIIAAATIMICVFSAFILIGQQVIGEFGLGLAAAVLLDAFILRTILVPALMHLSGRANWWLPSWPRPVAGIHTNQPRPGISGPERVPYQNPHMSSSLLNEIVRERLRPGIGAVPGHRSRPVGCHDHPARRAAGAPRREVRPAVAEGRRLRVPAGRRHPPQGLPRARQGLPAGDDRRVR